MRHDFKTGPLRCADRRIPIDRLSSSARTYGGCAQESCSCTLVSDCSSLTYNGSSLAYNGSGLASSSSPTAGGSTQTAGHWAVRTARGSFTLEAALLMTLILPVLLALIYLGLFLHDKGVLNGAAQETAACADLSRWKEHGNDHLDRRAKKLSDRTGPSRQVTASVTASQSRVAVSYSGRMSLPGLLPQLFGRSVLDTGASAERIFPDPADLIRRIRGLEYVSEMLKGESG